MACVTCVAEKSGIFQDSSAVCAGIAVANDSNAVSVANLATHLDSFIHVSSGRNGMLTAWPIKHREWCNTVPRLSSQTILIPGMDTLPRFALSDLAIEHEQYLENQ
jgi:hypothetical protein